MRRNWLAFIECLVRGHDDWVRRSPGRLFLRCERCGRETPGWTIVSAPPKPPARRPPSSISRFDSRKVHAPGDDNRARQNAAWKAGRHPRGQSRRGVVIGRITEGLGTSACVREYVSVPSGALENLGPGQLLFEFVHESDRAHFKCELVLTAKSVSLSRGPLRTIDGQLDSASGTDAAGTETPILVGAASWSAPVVIELVPLTFSDREPGFDRWRRPPG